MSKGRNFKRLEAEANYFACALLMPKDLFLSQWQTIQEKTKDEDTAVKYLAKVFQVPLFAVVLRMKMLSDCL